MESRRNEIRKERKHEQIVLFAERYAIKFAKPPSVDLTQKTVGGDRGVISATLRAYREDPPRFLGITDAVLRCFVAFDSTGGSVSRFHAWAIAGEAQPLPDLPGFWPDYNRQVAAAHTLHKLAASDPGRLSRSFDMAVRNMRGWVVSTYHLILRRAPELENAMPEEIRSLCVEATRIEETGTTGVRDAVSTYDQSDTSLADLVPNPDVDVPLGFIATQVDELDGLAGAAGGMLLNLHTVSVGAHLHGKCLYFYCGQGHWWDPSLEDSFFWLRDRWEGTKWASPPVGTPGDVMARSRTEHPNFHPTWNNLGLGLGHALNPAAAPNARIRLTVASRLAGISERALVARIRRAEGAHEWQPFERVNKEHGKGYEYRTSWPDLYRWMKTWEGKSAPRHKAADRP